jgi:hypothetical protein
VAIRGHGHVDGRTWLGQQAMPFGRRVVAEYGTGADAQDRAPELHLAPRLASEGGIDAALELLPVPVSDAIPDGLAVQAEINTLRASYDLFLKGDEFKAFIGEFERHGTSLSACFQSRKKQLKPVDAAAGSRLTVDNFDGLSALAAILWPLWPFA